MFKQTVAHVIRKGLFRFEHVSGSSHKKTGAQRFVKDSSKLQDFDMLDGPLEASRKADYP